MPDMTHSQFEALLGRQTSELTEDVTTTYERYRVAPARMRHQWRFDGREVAAPVWVVARDGSSVLGYDEVEEEWGIGLARAGVMEGEVVEDWGTFGANLRWALLHFPTPRYQADEQPGT